jgi:hypothetical protein
VKMAFYKGQGNFFDVLVRFVTRSEYSHCEIVIDGVCWSASPRDGGIRRTSINLQTGHWDVIDIQGDESATEFWFLCREGAGYDWIGLIRTVIPFFPHSESKWFCSEACGAALGLNASRLSPQDLFDRLRPI